MKRWHYFFAVAILITSNADTPVALGSCVDYEQRLHWVRTIPTPGVDRWIEVSGDYAYLANRTGLQVMDASDPAKPFLLGHVETGAGEPCGVDILGNYAYVVDRSLSSGLSVVDVSDPTSPEVVGSVATTGSSRSVAVRGSRVYIADDAAGLHIVDVVDPTAPTIVGTVALTGSAREVTVVGDYAYVAAYDAGLHIFDVSHPELPTLVGTVDTNGGALAVSISGNYAALAVDYAGVEIIDVSEPTSPTVVSAFDPEDRINAVTWVGDLVVTGGQILRAIDVSIPEEPEVVGEVFTNYCTRTLAVGPYLYVVHGWEDLRIFAPPVGKQPPLFVGSLETQVENMQLAASRELDLLCLVADSSLVVVDVASIGAPVPTGTTSLPGFVNDVALQGDHAYVTLFRPPFLYQLLVVDLGDPSAPLVVGQMATGYDQGGGRRSLAVSESCAYVVRDTEGSQLQVCDVSDPTSPFLVGDVDLGERASSVAVVGNHAYVGGPAASGLRVVDVSEPNAPRLVGSLATAADVVAVATSTERTYLLNGAQLTLVDVTKPNAPELLTNVELPLNLDFPPREVSALGNYVYITAGLAGLQVVDVTDAAQARYIGGAAPVCRDVVRSGAFVYVTVGQEMRILEAQCDEEPVSAPSSDQVEIDALSSITLQAFIDRVTPNPFRESATVDFTLVEAMRADVGVYDVSGRSVRHLAGGPRFAGAHSLSWDGRDDRGALVAGGVYFVRLSTSVGEDSWKVTFVRE